VQLRHLPEYGQMIPASGHHKNAAQSSWSGWDDRCVRGFAMCFERSEARPLLHHLAVGGTA